MSNIQQLVLAGVRFEAITQGISIDPKRFDPTANFTLAILGRDGGAREGNHP